MRVRSWGLQRKRDLAGRGCVAEGTDVREMPCRRIGISSSRLCSDEIHSKVCTVHRPEDHPSRRL